MTYENYERAQGWADQQFGEYSVEQADLFEAEINISSSLLAGIPLRVLDIGFGNGAFMGWVRDRGWLCEGLEVNPRLIERATERGYVAAADLSQLIAKPEWKAYDLITAFDVLEHIDREDLVPFLVSLHTACGPETLLLFRFPNGDSPFSGPVQNGDVTHRNAIGQSMLRQVAELADFNVAYLGSPPLPMHRATFKRRMYVLFGLPIRWFLGKFIRHLFMGGMNVVFTGNLMAVLKARRK